MSSTILRKVDFTFRVVVLITAMTLGVVFIFAGARHALAANLKTTAMITGDVMTVGDLFSGLSQEAASRVLGPAPQPGKDMVLNARTLMRIAVAMDLPWRPSHSTEQVTIRRAATLVEADAIRNVVSDELKKAGLEGRFDMTFISMPEPQMILPHEENATVELTKLDFDPQSDRFIATLAAPSKANALAELNISGKIDRLIPVPVLKSTLANGDIINSHDIQWIDVKSSDLQDDIVLDGKDLAGLTPRRMILSGKPVRNNELERPQLVSRGDMITISYNDGFMLLTAQGKAMQNGAKGDMIRVVNTASNRTLEAFVEDEYIVTVLP